MLWRDPREGTAAWRHLTQLPAKSFNQCVAVMDGFMYVAGGEDQNDARNQAKHAVGTLSRYVIANNLSSVDPINQSKTGVVQSCSWGPTFL